MKDKIVAGFFIGCLIATVVFLFAQQGLTWRETEQAKETRYTEAIAALGQQHYEEAIKFLDYIPDTIAYKEEKTLRAYASMQLARQEAEQTETAFGNPFDKAYGYASDISINYDGPLADEILEQRKETRAAYNQAEADWIQRKTELSRQQEERRLAEQKEFLAQLAQTVPYEGMSEEYIGMTMLGPADECENRDETDSRGTHYSRDYSWYADDGKLACNVWCIDKQVHKVAKYGTDIYWTADGKPDFSNTVRRREPKRPSKNESEDDPYNAKDYGYADDFYADHYDEFYDFEDAEDYWEAHDGGSN